MSERRISEKFGSNAVHTRHFAGNQAAGHSWRPAKKSSWRDVNRGNSAGSRICKKSSPALPFADVGPSGSVGLALKDSAAFGLSLENQP